MFSRILLFAGIVAALIGLVDTAAARPRRWVRMPSQSAVDDSSPASSEPIGQVIYPVADLVAPVPSWSSLDVEPLPGLRDADRAVKAQAASAPKKMRGYCPGLPLTSEGRTLERELMQLVKSTVAPASWKDKGGPGSVRFYPLGMALVVNQSPAVQEEVRALLDALRRMQDIESAVEIRIVTATPEAFDKACNEMNFKRVAARDNPAPQGLRSVAPKGKRWTAFLDKDQPRQLLEILQRDRNTNVVQSLKITLINEQVVAVQATENRFFLTSIEMAKPQGGDDVLFIPTQSPWLTGLSFGLQSTVSADRQSARVQVKGYWCNLAGPVELQPVQMPIRSKNEQGKEDTQLIQMFLQMPRFAQVRLDEELNIPDGGTALISCGVVPTEVKRDDLLAQLNRVFGGEALTTSADRHVFFLITPRVIINETEEAQR